MNCISTNYNTTSPSTRSAAVAVRRPKPLHSAHAEPQSLPWLSLWRRLPDGTRIYFRGRPHKLAATDRRPGLSEKSTFQVATSPANIQKITIKKMKSQIISWLNSQGKNEQNIIFLKSIKIRTNYRSSNRSDHLEKVWRAAISSLTAAFGGDR